MIDFDTSPVLQDYRQLFDGPEPCQFTRPQQIHSEQPTLPGLDSVPPVPQRPTINIEWVLEPAPAASDSPDNPHDRAPDNAPNGVPDGVPDHAHDHATGNAPDNVPEAEQVSGFLSLIKWSLVAALILAGLINYL